MMAERLGSFGPREFLKNTINIDKLTMSFDKLRTSSYFLRPLNPAKLLISFQKYIFANIIQNPLSATCNQNESGFVTTPAHFVASLSGNHSTVG